MNKRSFMSFATLLLFWIVISGVVNLQHLTVGVLISLFLVWFWKDFNPRLPSALSYKELFYFTRCVLMLVGYVIKSNIDVAKILLFSHKYSNSIFLELEPGIESNWGKVFLATCITITPGTVTIDVDPETNVFTVHALTRETGVSLYYWRIISEIKNLEKLIKRRTTNVMDDGGIYDSNSLSSAERNNGTNSN